jgi:calcium-dependent protein kinase
LHDKNIAHRDLKPENIIFTSSDEQDEINIKLIDFGLSKLLDINNGQMVTKLGTPYYVSPEVLEGNYDKKCDLWAIGVIAYILLSGIPPFNGKTEADVFRKIRCCDFSFPDKQWSYISDAAKDFISKLLYPDPNKRMNPDQALRHEWIKNASENVTISTDVLDLLRKFQTPKKLQQ